MAAAAAVVVAAAAAVTLVAVDMAAEAVGQDMGVEPAVAVVATMILTVGVDT